MAGASDKPRGFNALPPELVGEIFLRIGTTQDRTAFLCSSRGVLDKVHAALGEWRGEASRVVFPWTGTEERTMLSAHTKKMLEHGYLIACPARATDLGKYARVDLKKIVALPDALEEHGHTIRELYANIAHGLLMTGVGAPNFARFKVLETLHVGRMVSLYGAADRAAGQMEALQEVVVSAHVLAWMMSEAGQFEMVRVPGFERVPSVRDKGSGVSITQAGVDKCSALMALFSVSTIVEDPSSVIAICRVTGQAWPFESAQQACEHVIAEAENTVKIGGKRAWYVASGTEHVADSAIEDARRAAEAQLGSAYRVTAQPFQIRSGGRLACRVAFIVKRL